jgi:DNA polymerase III delta subunit
VSEIEKLHYRKAQHPDVQLSSAIVEEVAFGMTEADSFKFFDHLFANPEQACHILDDIQNEGTDRNQTSGMLYRGLKNYIIVLDFLHQGIDDSKTIASEAKINPWQVSTMLKQKDTLRQHAVGIKTFFKKLVELDYDIKMGHLPAEYFWLSVKELVLKLE